ncbi:unnamed protein product [Mytilus coruscus]|uniref:CCHC-type domain-containing protein n=1 Tax=Mytilus coruscus TaxID=42192 RepID=A0A6J7ZYH0_MYTCO|nr:unnamed protein product [Mytilus coruscus]
MEKLKNIRTGNRSAVTRIFRKFEEAKENTNFDRDELLATYDNLTQKKKLLVKLNEQILEATDSDNVESEIVDTDEYSNNLDTKLRHFRNFIQIGQNRTPRSNVTQSSYQVLNVESPPFRPANVDNFQNATPVYASFASQPQTSYNARLWRGEPQRITIVTETRNLRSQPFIASDDQISTGKQWEEWLESIEREFGYFRITEPEDKKDALIIYGGKDIARLERSLRNEEGEDEYNIFKSKLNKYYMPKRNKHHARYLFLKMKPLRDENTITYVTRLRENTINNQELIKRTTSKGWTLDKFVEEAGQMEDTYLQMKDMKLGDHSMSSVNKIQSNRSYNRAQEFEHDRFQQGYRNNRNMATKADSSYCGFDHNEERRCQAYGKQCRNCKRYNHFASVCRAEKKNQGRYDSQQQGRFVNYRNRRNVKKTTEDTSETDSNTDKSDYEEDEDYFGETTKHIMKIRKVKTIHETTDIEKNSDSKN